MKANLKNDSVPNKVGEEYVLFSGEKKDLVSVLANPFLSEDPEEVDKCVTAMLNDLYGVYLARGIRYLLGHADEEVRCRFVYTYMMPECLACFATSTIVVRESLPKERRTPNIGHFVITACSACGQEHLLHFLNQVSAVYYLMYLITRKNQTGMLPAVDLNRNEASFVSLYHTVYADITPKQAKQRYDQLRYRVVDGKYRAGRKTQIESDIREQLAKAFATFGDSPVPFGMSSNRHLTVSPDRIVFEGNARCLLHLPFC